uniref:Calcyon neuron specific vesicular protein n=1 Tax=Ursus maritimus TaxID=29073 RepID=A0A452U004_URSMA
MVKLGCSFSGKPGKDPGDQDGATTDSVPLISPLDVSQLQPPFPDQVVIKTQTEYQLSSPDQPKKFPDLEAQKLACNHPEEGRRLPTARMIAFAMALLGCVLIMYKAIWYDQFTCPDGFLLRVRPGELRDRVRSGAVQTLPCVDTAGAESWGEGLPWPYCDPVGNTEPGAQTMWDHPASRPERHVGETGVPGVPEKPWTPWRPDGGCGSGQVRAGL